MSKPSESDVYSSRVTTTKEATRQAAIVRGLTRRGAWVTKLHAGGYTRPGLPDLVACYRGIFVAIEVKQPGASTQRARRDRQIAELVSVRAAGGVSMLATSWKEVSDALDDIDCVLARVAVPAWDQRPLPERKVVSL